MHIFLWVFVAPSIPRYCSFIFMSFALRTLLSCSISLPGLGFINFGFPSPPVPAVLSSSTIPMVPPHASVQFLLVRFFFRLRLPRLPTLRWLLPPPVPLPPWFSPLTLPGHAAAFLARFSRSSFSALLRFFPRLPPPTFCSLFVFFAAFPISPCPNTLLVTFFSIRALRACFAPMVLPVFLAVSFPSLGPRSLPVRSVGSLQPPRPLSPRRLSRYFSPPGYNSSVLPPCCPLPLCAVDFASALLICLLHDRLFLLFVSSFMLVCGISLQFFPFHGSVFPPCLMALFPFSIAYRASFSAASVDPSFPCVLAAASLSCFASVGALASSCLPFSWL